MVGAIVIVASDLDEGGDSVSAHKTTGDGGAGSLRLGQRVPLVCVEILGRSTVERALEDLHRGGIETISLFTNSSLGPFHGGISHLANLPSYRMDDVWSGAKLKLAEYRERGIDTVVIVRVDAYAELEIADALQFHREQHEALTRVFNADGPLDIWILDAASLNLAADLLTSLRAAEPVRYLVRGYVNRLERPRDLRQLVVDALTFRCRLHPEGAEVRPGVWLEEGAQVHRGARIVAPAFIGRNAKIAEQCLITRCSDVETNCHVDYGTVVEDSSILSNTYVGIGLDLSHSLVDGNNLINLEHDVTMEIADPGVIRQNRPRKETYRKAPVAYGYRELTFSPAEDGTR